MYDDKKEGETHMFSLFQKLLIAALIASTAHAQYYDLRCVEGDIACSDEHCTTIVFRNKTSASKSVSGQLRAKLTGAAKWAHDGKFTFKKIFPEASTFSCHIPTDEFRKKVSHINVEVRSDNGDCRHFVPKNAVSGNQKYYTDLDANYCVISQG